MRILQSVWEIVAIKGFPGVTMRNVAKQAEVSLGRVQYYFKTKDELIVESCRALVSEPWLPSDGGEVSLAELKRQIGGVIPAGDAARQRAIVWNAYSVQSVVQSAIADILTDAMRAAERRIAEMVVAVSNSGANGADTNANGADTDIDMEEGRAIARTLIAIADGLTMRVLIGDLSHDEATELIDWEVEGVFLQE